MNQNLSESTNAIVPLPKLNQSSKQLAIQRGSELSPSYVPHLGFDEILRLIDAAESLSQRPGIRERNCLLVQALFDSCLRVSELLAVTPKDIIHSGNGWSLRVFTGKRRTWDTAAISPSLAAQLQAYAYRHNIASDHRIFTINASRVFQIVKAAFANTNLVKPKGVGTVHVLRHSGALERLRRTRNPQSIQEQLRHSSFKMTMRYFKTLSHEESMAIQQEIDYQW